MKRFVTLLLFGILCMQAGNAQTGRDARLKMKGYINPQEIVSLDSTMRMDQALLVLNELSKQFAGKIIIDLEKHKNPIGVYVVNQHWREALDMVLSHNGLTYVEEAEYIRILPQGAQITGAGGPGGPAAAPSEPPPTLDTRDVKISAAFFSTNISKLQQYGISWNFFRSKTKEPTINGYIATGIARGDTASPVPPVGTGGASTVPALDKALAIIKSPPEFTFANIDALVKFYGTNGLGEVITSPELTVRNNKPGKIQIGKDIFVTTRDIAGNTVNQEISTGTIIDVIPTVYSQSDTDFIYLNIKIEQSDATTSAEISKNTVSTHALLYDGEETVIGGLVSSLDQETREGVPILKDLPWWFLGLRYIFGSEEKTKTKNELIILLKAELTKPIRERISHPRKQRDIIDGKRTEYQGMFEKQ